MLKNNKFKLLMSCVIILLPIIFGIISWNDLPDNMTVHWSADGSPNGFASKIFTVFGMPLILTGFHLAALLLTSLDKKQREQSPKVQGMVFWIIPVISLFVNGIIYFAALGKSYNFVLFTPALLGALFIMIGNYMPKTRQNHTLGVKIYWTLTNEENWNRTHRVAGKVWVVGGAAMMLSVLLPVKAMIGVNGILIVAMVAFPIIYSYLVYRNHKKDGIKYEAYPKSKTEKIVAWITAAVICVILTAITVIMLTGDIRVDFEKDGFKINASYWSDAEVEYSEIDFVEYRNDLDVGVRINGFGSSKLSMGAFRNDEFGEYTLYAYTGAKDFAVLKSGESTLVIGLKTGSETKSLCNEIEEKTES